MHTLHVKKSHSDCSQSLIKNHPNRVLCRLLLLHHVFVRFVYYFMQSKTQRSLFFHSNSPFPLSRKSAVICWQSARNYRNKPYIAEKRMLSAIRSNLNYFDGANCWRVMVTWIQLGLTCRRRHSRFKRVKADVDVSSHGKAMRVKVEKRWAVTSCAETLSRFSSELCTGRRPCKQRRRMELISLLITVTDTNQLERPQTRLSLYFQVPDI